MHEHSLERSLAERGSKEYLRREAQEICSVLLSSKADAEKVRAWLKKHARLEIGGYLTSSGDLEIWEVELWALALYIDFFLRNLSQRGTWEMGGGISKGQTRSCPARGNTRACLGHGARRRHPSTLSPGFRLL
jgi:hypothetical protein